jgi:hypothetical protein
MEQQWEEGMICQKLPFNFMHKPKNSLKGVKTAWLAAITVWMCDQRFGLVLNHECKARLRGIPATVWRASRSAAWRVCFVACHKGAASQMASSFSEYLMHRIRSNRVAVSIPHCVQMPFSIAKSCRRMLAELFRSI